MSLSQSFAGGKIGAGAVEKEAPVVERINHPFGNGYEWFNSTFGEIGDGSYILVSPTLPSGKQW